MHKLKNVIKMKHLINWVEIPVTDLKRAIPFYNAILGIHLEEMQMGEATYAIFPSQNQFNTGALVQGPYHKPSGDGVIVYLDGGTDLAMILSKVKAAGGTVTMEKTFISEEAGNIGMFIDTEGNTIGLQHM